MTIEKITNDLVEIGRQQAILLCAPPASEVEIRKKIDELLIHRKVYEAAMRNIITRSELANLILAHFQTLICKEAGVAEPSELIDYEELSKKIIKIVYW
jgi:predicted ATPase